jgi:hypothetical protein
MLSISYIYVGERYQCLISMSANVINVLYLCRLTLSMSYFVLKEIVGVHPGYRRLSVTVQQIWTRYGLTNPV